MSATSSSRRRGWGAAAIAGLALLLAGADSCDPRLAEVYGWSMLEPPAAADRILVVAPHVDDEAIAAGGYTVAAVAQGAQVFVCYLTAGDCNRTSAEIMDFTLRPRPATFLREGERRFREAREAMSRLGIGADRLYLLGYPDRGLRPMLAAPGKLVRSPGTGRTAVPYPNAVAPGAEYRLQNLERDLAAVLRAVAPTVVVLPVPFDAHPDHAAGGEVTLRVLAASGLAPRRLGYLVHALHFPSPFHYAPRHLLLPPRAFLTRPWSVFPLTRDEEAKKRRALQAYRSQRQDPYLFVLTDAFVRKNELFVRLP
jgi:LmbE family N-acetylglucosaminyl deacetylase